MGDLKVTSDKDYDDDDNFYDDYDNEDQDQDVMSDESYRDYLKEEIKGQGKESISLDMKVTSISSGGAKDDTWHFANEENNKFSKFSKDMSYEYVASEYEGEGYDAWR